MPSLKTLSDSHRQSWERLDSSGETIYSYYEHIPITKTDLTITRVASSLKLVKDGSEIPSNILSAVLMIGL
jgi:hypothetical protein